MTRADDAERVRAILAVKAYRAVRPRYILDLFEEQRLAVEDESPRVAWLCGRRSGKTVCAVSDLLWRSEQIAGATNVYIALTRETAKRLAWSEILRMDARYDLGLKLNRTDLIATTKNGSQILCTGADDSKTVERLRGGKYRLVVVDEAASFRPGVLDVLVEEIIGPALVDLMGQLVLVGTPGPTCAGPFFEMTERPGPWSVHRWTAWQNLYLPHWDAEVAAIRKRNGWSEAHPRYQREYLGRWVNDPDSLVYRYDDRRNGCDELPERNDWRFVLAFDLGASEKKPTTAAVVWAYSQHVKVAYAVESEARAAQTPHTIAGWTKTLMSRYDLDALVMDPGGLGRAYIAELNARHDLPFVEAMGRHKTAYVEHMNGDFEAKRIRVVRRSCPGLVAAWATLPWNEARTDSDEKYPDHETDAALYGWRRCRAFDAEPERESIVRGETQDWREREHFAAIEKIREERRMDLEREAREEWDLVDMGFEPW